MNDKARRASVGVVVSVPDEVADMSLDEHPPPIYPLLRIGAFSLLSCVSRFSSGMVRFDSVR